MELSRSTPWNGYSTNASQGHHTGSRSHAFLDKRVDTPLVLQEHGHRCILIVLALMIAACLSVAALAEGSAETAADTAAAEAAKAAADEAQAAADAAQAEAIALNEALEAYSKAKAESRKLAILTSLKEELDNYVAAGTLTQEQADLILKYYAEQLTLQMQNGTGFGRGGKGGRSDKGFRNGQMNGMSSGNDVNSQNAFGGRHGRFGNTVPAQPKIQEAPAAPAVPADQGTNNT